MVIVLLISSGNLLIPLFNFSCRFLISTLYQGPVCWAHYTLEVLKVVEFVRPLSVNIA